MVVSVWTFDATSGDLQDFYTEKAPDIETWW